MRPPDAVTLDEAAHVLGCSVQTVRRYVIAGRLPNHGDRYEHRRLSLADVERVAREVYRWRRDLDNPESYWVTGQRAADVLGVNRARLGQLADKGKIPFDVHADGTRLFRREQLTTVANARDARKGLL